MADNVTQLGVSKEQITRIIQLIVADSSRVFFTDESSMQEKDLVINRLQVFSCLKKGEVITEPQITTEGYVECEMTFFCAGQDVHVDVAVQYDDKQNRILVVRKIAKE
ncbi:MAG: hypothetical protein WBO34_00130 [Gammaproteobacteria bacterium]